MQNEALDVCKTQLKVKSPLFLLPSLLSSPSTKGSAQMKPNLCVVSRSCSSAEAWKPGADPQSRASTQLSSRRSSRLTFLLPGEHLISSPFSPLLPPAGRLRSLARCASTSSHTFCRFCWSPFRVNRTLGGSLATPSHLRPQPRDETSRSPESTLSVLPRGLTFIFTSRLVLGSAGRLQHLLKVST